MPCRKTLTFLSKVCGYASLALCDCGDLRAFFAGLDCSHWGPSLAVLRGSLCGFDAVLRTAGHSRHRQAAVWPAGLADLLRTRPERMECREGWGKTSCNMVVSIFFR